MDKHTNMPFESIASPDIEALTRSILRGPNANTSVHQTVDMPDSANDTAGEPQSATLSEHTRQAEDIAPLADNKSTLQDKKDQPLNHESDRASSKNVMLRVGKIAWDIFFYTFLVLLVFSIGVYSGENRSPKVVFGYSFFTILTSSMQSELPKGSFVVVKQVDANTIAVGDDITFMVDETTTVTHRVIAIHENYNESGKPGFETQGVDNPTPDQDIVYSDNVVGVVVLSMPVLGTVLAVVGRNLWIFAIILVLITALFFSLRVLLKKEDSDRESQPDAVERNNEKA